MSVERQMYAFWRDWFAQADAEKRKHLRQPGKGGWYPPGSEAPGYEAQADAKEYFHFRAAHCEMDAATWDVWVACFRQAQNWLTTNGLRDLAALDISNHVLRIIRYPPAVDGNVGQAHCDFDLLTVSVPGTQPGLEVFDAGGWTLRESNEIHVGEMLTHYAKIPATPHRVQSPPNTERLKAVFFYLPPNNFELKPGFTAGDYLRDVLTKAGTASVGVA